MNTDRLDALLRDAAVGEERLQGELAERRRIGIAAANNYLLVFLVAREIDEATRGRLDAYEDVAVRICGLGTPFSSLGERDLTPQERATEFLALPELAFHRDIPYGAVPEVTRHDHRSDA